MRGNTIIFLFFNEAVRSVYIVINKVITTAMAFCLSHLENWMQYLFNSPIMVSWSVTDFYNDSCNTSAIIYCEMRTLWPFTRVLVRLQPSWARISVDRCKPASAVGVCWVALGQAGRPALFQLAMPAVCLLQLSTAMQEVLGSLLFLARWEILFLGTPSLCPAWRVLCKKLCFFGFPVMTHHLRQAKKSIASDERREETVAQLSSWLVSLAFWFLIN